MLLLYRTVFKYGLISGSLIVVFALLKSGWYFSGRYPDLYITLIAAVFMVMGLYASRKINRTKAVVEQTTEAETEVDPVNLLSKRELKVLEQLHTDLSNKEIAGLLCIELSTLKTHINSIYKKLEVKNREGLRLKLNYGKSF
jgi:DNA-binding NarL/FixJ family response regulator